MNHQNPGHSNSQLSLTRVPVALWSLSFLIFIGTTILVLHLDGKIKIFHGFGEGHWWQYLIVILMYALSLIFFLFGKLQVVCFNNETGKMTLRKWILCYKWRDSTQLISDIHSVNLIKSGIENVHSDTIHYKVSVDFKHGLQLLIGETNNEREGMVKALKVRKFLNIGGNVEFKDYSRI